MLTFLACTFLFGCANYGAPPATPTISPLAGSAHGGQQPLTGAHVQLYAASPKGDGAAAQSLVNKTVQTDENGNFSLSGLYQCPTADTFVYLVAIGGNPGLPAGKVNANAALMTALGPCGALTDATFVQMNEVTTVASVYALAKFMQGYDQVGFADADISDFVHATATVSSLVDIATGHAQGPLLPGGAIAPTSKLNTLANVVAACINSVGGISGDGSVCGHLFQYATTGSNMAPTNTVDAALAIAQTPTRTVDQIFSLAPSFGVFAPALATSPDDWTLQVYAPPAAPVITPASGTYTKGQSVSIVSATTGASIHYTTDGSAPTIASSIYTVPILLAQSETLRALAVNGPLVSASTTETYSVASPITVSISPAATTLLAGQVEQFSATVSGTLQTAVTWSVSPSLGSVSSAGIYTAPSVVPSPQTVEVTATSVAAPTQSSSAVLTLTPVSGKLYYLASASAGGKDGNDGLTPSKPWLTPNHALVCGDTIIAKAGKDYASSNFETGNWGSVSCPTKDNVAWLKCENFDACHVTASPRQPGFYVDKSYWGVQGWEVNGNDPASNWCFGAAPSYSAPVTIHHIVFANNVANGCQQGGFVSFNSGRHAGVDYLALVGNIAYNAAQNDLNCYSGISIYQPVAVDTLTGTHVYAGGNISYANFNPDPCAGGKPSDGEGLIFDTFDGDQGGLEPYTGQALAENNIVFSNGGRGLQVGNNKMGSGPFASIILRHNTAWGNNLDLNQQSNTTCGEIDLFNTVNTKAFNNLGVTSAPLGCGANPIYGLFAYDVDASDAVYGNWASAVSGSGIGAANSGTFVYGLANILGDPKLFQPSSPGAPECAGYSNAPACMQKTIENLRPLNPLAIAYGYQTPLDLPFYDPVFPQWLCNVNLPSGLVTMGCNVIR